MISNDTNGKSQGRVESGVSRPEGSSSPSDDGKGYPGTSAEQAAGKPPAIPDYELIRQIGHGSYGQVWLARSVTGVFRAIKIVFRQSFSNERPYQREFKGIQRFEPISRSHDSQVDVLHVGCNAHEGYFYYVMELADDANEEISAESGVKGQRVHSGGKTAEARIHAEKYVPRTLKREMEKRGPLPVEECIQIGLSLTTALENLHHHGLVHRDVKPSNIIFINGVPKLADIGLVTDLDATVSFVGTEGYIPPEGPGTPQADLYSLGKVLYEICTAKDRQDFPEPPTNWEERQDEPALREFHEILLKACEPEARRRYHSASEMRADFSMLQGGKSIRRLRALEKRLAVAKRVSLAAAVLALLAFGGYFAAQSQARRARKTSEMETRLRREAEAQNRKSQQIARFLEEMLQAVGPAVARGRDTTMLREILERTAERVDKDLANQPEVQIELWGTLAETFRQLGLYKRMEELARRNYELSRSNSGEQNLAVADALSQMADAQMHLGNLEQADELTRKALEMKKKLLGNEHPEVAALLSNLGRLLRLRSKPAEAESMQREALTMRKKLLGPEHPEVATSLYLLAAVLRDGGKFDEAESLLREALPMQRKLLGDEHPDVVASLDILARLLERQGKFGEAETMHRQVLVMQRKLLGDEHPDVANSLGYLALTLRDQNKLPEAEDSYRQALSLNQKIWAGDPRKWQRNIYDLADVLCREHRESDAEELWRNVLTPDLEGLPNCAGVLRDRGFFRARHGQWENAAADIVKVIKFEPANHLNHYALCLIFVAIPEPDGYHQECRHLVAQFGQTEDPIVAGQIANACLILPSSEAHLETLSRLANVANTVGINDRYRREAEFCKGLVEYRQGHFTKVGEWMHLIATNSWDYSGQVAAHMVLAMVEHQLNQTAEAHAILARGLKVADSKLPPIDSRDLGTNWFGWIRAHAFIKEAKALIEGPAEQAKK